MTEGLAESPIAGSLSDGEVVYEKPRKSSSIIRIGRTVFWLLAIAISLLVFPASLGWMVASWLVCATFRFVRGKSIWLPALVAAIVIVVKGGHQSPAMCILTSHSLPLREVPRGAIRDPSFGIERELSAKHDLALVGDGANRWLVYLSKPAPTRHIFFWTSTKSDDGIHANDEGNRLLASRVAKTLRRNGIIDSE